MARKKESRQRIDDARLYTIKSIMHERNINVTELSNMTSIRRETLYRILNGVQPLTMNTLEILARFLETPLLAFTDDKMFTGKTLSGSSYNVVRSIADLFIRRDIILSQEQERSRRYAEQWYDAKPLSLDVFKFRCEFEYDTSKIECWSFNSGGDIRESINLRLGNMVNGYGLKILGILFPNSEVPYQLAIFRDTREALKVQNMALYDESVSNGLKFKRKFIYNAQYKYVRRDLDFEMGKQLWCYEWMKFVVWEKCKQNQAFRKILLSIPRNAMIIEQAQHKDKLMWGCWNDELREARNVLKKTAMIENFVKKSSKKVMEAEYKVNNIGIWKGQNAMGQILTMCKICLYDGVELPIDIELLNEARINWFGQKLYFEKGDDGAVSVRAI